MKTKYIVGSIISAIICIITITHPEKYHVAMLILWIISLIISLYLLFTDKNGINKN